MMFGKNKGDPMDKKTDTEIKVDECQKLTLEMLDRVSVLEGEVRSLTESMGGLIKLSETVQNSFGSLAKDVLTLTQAFEFITDKNDGFLPTLKKEVIYLEDMAERRLSTLELLLFLFKTTNDAEHGKPLPPEQIRNLANDLGVNVKDLVCNECHEAIEADKQRLN
jgi:hypothetical protein